MAKTFDNMTDAELKEAARMIVRASSSEAEVRERIARELQYPYGIAVTSHLPTDAVGRQARGIVSTLGGLTLRNGAMVMVMLQGHDGTISL